MEAKVVYEQLSSAGCVVRRCLAKVVDVILFGLLAYPLAILAVQQPIRFDGLVPAVLSALWILGFIISADLVCTLAFGVTPGELVAGIRVTSVEGRRLALSERQDRTTDSLVEGTVGCYALLPMFWQKKPAPYDKGCEVRFHRMSPQRLMATLLIATAFCAVAGAAGVALGIRNFESNAPVVLTRLLSQLGFEVGERWVNPVTGATVSLPKGWSVITSEVTRSFGEQRVEFACRAPQADVACQIRMVISPGFEMPEIVEAETSADALENSLSLMIHDEVEPGSVNDRQDIKGESRLNTLYAGRLLDDRERARGNLGTAFIWFTQRRHTWALSLYRPAAANETSEEAVDLAFSLIRSTLVQK
jgi:hypothetical protein